MIKWNPERNSMNEDNINMEIRKFLKKVGITSQRIIENQINMANKRIVNNFTLFLLFFSNKIINTNIDNMNKTPFPINDEMLVIISLFREFIMMLILSMFKPST